ncbi:hypothetical protein R3P38DRAFT_2902732 [Favolaschia claudopus]|uniref:Transmembrane protein n=1 Tax=Favolaschia claudopus TaxID=2862362 RepID=A0AAW0CJJ8_9AGAR
MARRFTGEAGAALVFLIGYSAIFAWMLFAFMTHRMKWRSRYSFLFFHVTLRVVSQACGVGFGVLGFANMNLFLAFLILGAEGYFSLVLCSFRFLISWHQRNLSTGESWLEPREPPGKSALQKWREFFIFLLLGPFAFLVFRDNPMTFFHSALILANASIITGGSYLAGADYDMPDDPDTKRKLLVSKITRTSGQAVFFAGNAFLLVVILVTMRNNTRDGDSRKKKGTVHPTLWLLLASWFPLIVRGVFGLLQACVWDLSYYNLDNYRADGFTPRFTLIEYLLGVMTEWVACVLLNLTYLTSRHDPPKPPVRISASNSEKFGGTELEGRREDEVSTTL